MRWYDRTRASLVGSILWLVPSILGIRIPSDIASRLVMGSPSVHQYTHVEYEEERGHTGNSSHVLAS
jgi:hypothetical protein